MWCPLVFLIPLIERLFNIKARISALKTSNALFVEAVGKNIVSFLESKGFKPGDKIRNKLRIPSWIKQNPHYLSACLRGLYDTDGCVYKLTNQNSHQISFSNRNRGLLEDLREGLITLGISPSHITKGKETNITKKSELAKFLKLVGFHNSKHLDKVKMWKIAPSSSGQI
jgi:intein/homing endonuclease